MAYKPRPFRPHKYQPPPTEIIPARWWLAGFACASLLCTVPALVGWYLSAH